MKPRKKSQKVNKLVSSVFGEVCPCCNSNPHQQFGRRKLQPYNNVFEQDVAELLGNKVRKSDKAAKELWGALCNSAWDNQTKGIDSEEGGWFSFRAAGNFIAALRNEGNYMDWYCSGTAAHCPDWISKLMATRGWEHTPLSAEIPYGSF